MDYFQRQNLHSMTSSRTEIPEDRVQEWPDWRVARALVCLTVCTGVGKQLHTLPSHPTLGEPRSSSQGMLADITTKNFMLAPSENTISFHCTQ